MTIELGVLPAELVQGHVTTARRSERPARRHASGQQLRHIVVALLDAKTGARITDARIRAGVGDRSYNHAPDSAPEPMEINGAIRYGNFFLMQGAGVWRIHLEIVRPGASRPVEADFAYEHVSDR